MAARTFGFVALILIVLANPVLDGLLLLSLLALEFFVLACDGSGLTALQSRHILQSEAGSEQGNLDFVAEGVVGAKTPFGLNVVKMELSHELIDLVHFLHREFIGRVGGAEGNVEEDFL